MDKDNKIKISIPRADDKEVVNLSKGNIGEINKRFEKIDQVLYGVMISVVLSMVAIIVSVIGLFIDQMRANNEAYKEYSQKTESVKDTQKINQALLEQNKKNQQLILEQQKQIKTLLNR